MMTDYSENCKKYIAPYTSLVTSSMMGKTRLMKEMSKHIPNVYFCLRNPQSNGYPNRTSVLANWIETGIISQQGLEPALLELLPNQFYLPTLKYASFLLCLMEKLILLAENDGLFRRHNISRSDFQWMWYFFAEPPKALQEELDKFWREVTSEADKMVKKHLFDSADYFVSRYSESVSSVSIRLQGGG